MEGQFIELCRRGDLAGAQQFYHLNPTINISFNNEEAFRLACFNGHLHVAQWLLQVCPTIYIPARNEYAFRWACYSGRLHVAQWLLQVCPMIDISVGKEEAFRWVCDNGYLHVAKWLQSLKPYLYVIEYDEDGNYKGCKIRNKKDANWEQRKYLVWLASDHCPEINKNNLLYKLPSDVSRLLIGFV
jgi:hypothetical protein